MNVGIFLPKARPRPFILDGIAEYRKRLSKICDLRVSYGDGHKNEPPRGAVRSVLNVLISGGAGSRDMTSEEFAAWIQAALNRSVSGFAFWIPESGEKPDKPAAAWDEAIRLTYIETDWDLTALILAEQVYRAFMILGGSAYHK